MLVGVGYLIGETRGSAAALLTALAGFGIGVDISGLAFLIAAYAYDRLETIPAFAADATDATRSMTEQQIQTARPCTRNAWLS